ncbi:hypothetical protein J2Z21_003569 [Streptomyces griseochromogenes]|uniref:Uncharacterized protein n=1 Tax=Streptomyces griseochromogenes TaxID=68214 RepID=A0ABS4LTB5_9ACTN|nr:hypothetical protein [Streptomyces griseochromogenes]MBP2050630.1 hypothetical protein [Streptomyces griseochromogenes]
MPARGIVMVAGPGVRGGLDVPLVPRGRPLVRAVRRRVRAVRRPVPEG